MHLHLDAVGGVAGDMFIAALLDAFPQWRDGLTDAIRAAGLPQGYAVSLAEYRDHALAGKQFLVQAAEHERDESLHDHPHKPFAEIRGMLLASGLAAQVRDHAIGIFTLLAQAEANVHGTTVDAIGFHEVGDWDSIADIVGAAFLISILQATWSVGALPLGSGRVKSAHGLLPVPAPATALLLEGFECLDDGIGGERVTPTGAAILRYLRQFPGPQRGRLAATGTGFGTRRLPGLSNVLRVLAFETDASANRDRVAEILFEVDDQTPEDLAIGLERIRRHPGTRDVLQVPAFGKKGRVTMHVRVLADPGRVEEITDLCLTETATIGLRFHVLERKTLVRRQVEGTTGEGSLRAKEVERLGAVTRKAEADDLKDVAGYAERARIRRRIEGDES